MCRKVTKKPMRTISWMGCVFLLALAAGGQTASDTAKKPVKPNPLAPYAGNWTAELDGRAWLIVKLAMQGDQITGSIQRPNKLNFSDDGNVKSVSEERLTETVQAAQINNDSLFLTVKAADATETDRFVMRLTGENSAEMKMVAMSMPPGMPKPKPWKLAKAPGSGAPATH